MNNKFNLPNGVEGIVSPTDDIVDVHFKYYYKGDFSEATRSLIMYLIQTLESWGKYQGEHPNDTDVAAEKIEKLGKSAGRMGHA